MVTAKRSLYPPTPTPAPRNISVTRADVHHDSDIDVKDILAKMSADMHMLFTSLSERIDKLDGQALSSGYPLKWPNYWTSASTVN